MYKNEHNEHCKSIAEELEKYVDGLMYRCPECGEIIEFDDECYDEENKSYCCPCCGESVDCNYMEQLSLYDYFEDCLDIEYRCDGSKNFRSVCIMVACGGPNIYIDTGSKNVELYWWTESGRYSLSRDVVAAIDEWAEEMWNL